MKNIYDFNEIGYEAATFPVDEATQKYLQENYFDASSNRVDANDRRLAVKLNADGTVGFGAETPTAADAIIGILNTYEMDGSAGVQFRGGVDLVPTTAALEAGRKTLVVNNKGEISVLEGGANVIVAKPATVGDKFASIILG